MHMTNRRQRRSKEQIADLLKEFHSSGLSQSAFAKQHGLTQSFISLRLKKARLQPTQSVPASPAFLEVELPKHPGPFDYRVTLGGGMALEMRSGFAPVELASLLQVLARTPSARCYSGAL